MPDYLGNYLGSLQALHQFGIQQQQAQLQQKQLDEQIRSRQQEDRFREAAQQRADIATQLSLASSTQPLDPNGQVTRAVNVTGGLPTPVRGATPDGTDLAAPMIDPARLYQGARFEGQVTPPSSSVIDFKNQKYYVPTPEEQAHTQLAQHVMQSKALADATGVLLPPEVADSLGLARAQKVPSEVAPSYLRTYDAIQKLKGGGDKDYSFFNTTDDTGKVHAYRQDKSGGTVEEVKSFEGAGKSKASEQEKAQARIMVVNATGSAGTDGLSGSALDQAATLYATNGTLPALGIGGAAAKVKSQIMNRAAELFNGSNLASNKGDYVANTRALSALTQNRAAVEAFSNTASKNIDLFLEKAQKIVDTGSPLINGPLRSIDEHVFGNPAIAGFNAARNVALSEIAKVTSSPGLSGVLSDSARKEVQEYNPASASLKQTIEVARTLKRDIQNRKTSMDDEIKNLRNNINSIASGNGSAPAEKKATHRFNPATGKIEAIQ